MTAAPHSIDPTTYLDDLLAQASPDLMRQMLQGFINQILSAWGVMIPVDGETHRSGRIESCHVSIRISFVSSALMRC